MKLIEAKCKSRRIPFLVHVNYSLVDTETKEQAGCGTAMNTCGREHNGTFRMSLAGAIASGRITASELVKASLAAAAASKSDVEG